MEIGVEERGKRVKKRIKHEHVRISSNTATSAANKSSAMLLVRSINKQSLAAIIRFSTKFIVYSNSLFAHRSADDVATEPNLLLECVKLLWLPRCFVLIFFSALLLSVDMVFI